MICMQRSLLVTYCSIGFSPDRRTHRKSIVSESNESQSSINTPPFFNHSYSHSIFWSALPLPLSGHVLLLLELLLVNSKLSGCMRSSTHGRVPPTSLTAHVFSVTWPRCIFSSYRALRTVPASFSHSIFSPAFLINAAYRSQNFLLS